METDRPAQRSLAVRVIVFLTVVATLIGCVFVAARSVRPPAEPAASDLRAKTIANDRAVILAECEKAAGGNWDHWQRETAPYRAALKDRIDRPKPSDPAREPWLEGRPRVLEAKDEFPLVEVQPDKGLDYLYDGERLDQFRKDRAVVAASRWLRQRGIDLIFLPVPKMTELYAEHFVDDCPPDGIIGPHVRRSICQLLDNDVEVVDGLPLYRPARDPDPEYLYNAADTHWGPRAMRIMAREVANRIQRYGFGAEARSAPSIVQASPGSFDIQLVPSSVKEGDLPRMDGWAYLTAKQRERVELVQARTIEHVTLPDGSEPRDDPKSPVLLIGNSFIPNFRELLIKELNLLIRTRWAPAETTEEFIAFLREPELLDGCRVLVWVLSEEHLAHLHPMPAPVMKVLESGQ
jgi:hypothetical protein